MKYPNSIDYDSVVGEYRKTVLDSGLRVVTESMHGVQSLAIGVWVLTGSRFEDLSQNGISHLLEHMVFKGTHSRSAYDIAVSLEALGGHLNAFTGREHTCYYAIVLKDNLAEAVDVLADLVQNARLDKSDLAKEKRVVLEEIHNLDDMPEDLVHDIWMQTVFGEDALGWPILGTQESIAHIRKEQVQSYYQTHYTASNIIVAAAGALDHNELVERVGNAFASLPKGATKPVPQANAPREKADKQIHSATNQLHLCTGTTVYSYLDKRKFPLFVLNAYLGSGMSSRLFQELREARGLAYAVFSSLDFWIDIGVFSVYVGTGPENQQAVTQVLEDELQRLIREPIPINDIKRVQSQLSRSIILSLEDHSNRMNRLAKMEAYTETYMPIVEVVRLIEEVDQSQILTVSKDIFENQVQISTSIQPE